MGCGESKQTQAIVNNKVDINNLIANKNLNKAPESAKAEAPSKPVAAPEKQAKAPVVEESKPKDTDLRQEAKQKANPEAATATQELAVKSQAKKETEQPPDQSLSGQRGHSTQDEQRGQDSNHSADS